MATNFDWCLLEVAFFYKKITERVSNSQFYTLIFNNQWYSHCYRQSLFLIKSIFQSSVLRQYNLDSGFQWFLGLQSSLSCINADPKAENFAFYMQMFSISLKTTVIPRRNWEQWSCKTPKLICFVRPMNIDSASWELRGYYFHIKDSAL